MTNKKILYVRSAPYKVNISGYNLQEIGLGKAFCNLGYDFDIVYYSDEDKIQNLEVEGKGNLRIIWSNGIRVLRAGIYPKILKKDFLNQYDQIIISEYGQIMAVLLNRLHNNVYIYNGPYYNLFKIKFIELLYDKLFVNFLDRNSKKVFCKTRMAEKYLNDKGFKNTLPVGVGLDIDNYTENLTMDDVTKKICAKMSKKKNILYVGSISPRKNVELVIKSFINFKEKNTIDAQLVIIGNGSKKYKKHCKSLIPLKYTNDVVWIDFLSNAQLKFIYNKADVFMLASKKEIFGMVLLEAMYFGVPTITSLSAGSDTLIRDGNNGFIIKDESVDAWSDKIELLLCDNNLAKKIGASARKTIVNDFTWDKIAVKMEKEFVK